MLQRTIRVVLPTGSPRPAGVDYLGPATPAAIWSAMDAQDTLASGVLADLKAQADAKFIITAAILGTLGDDVIDQALRNATISKALKLEMSTPEVVFGIFPRGEALSTVAKNAYAPAGDFDQNRKTIEVTNGQQLVDEDGKLKPSPAVAAINRALQQSRTGQVSVNWDMVVLSLLGMCISVGEKVTYLD